MIIRKFVIKVTERRWTSTQGGQIYHPKIKSAPVHHIARQHDFDLAASISHLPAVPISGWSLDKSSHAVGGWLKRGIRKAYRVSMMLVRGNSARTWSLGLLTVPSDGHDRPSRLVSGTSKHFSDNFNKHGITDSAA